MDEADGFLRPDPRGAGGGSDNSGGVVREGYRVRIRQRRGDLVVGEDAVAEGEPAGAPAAAEVGPLLEDAGDDDVVVGVIGFGSGGGERGVIRAGRGAVDRDAAERVHLPRAHPDPNPNLGLDPISQQLRLRFHGEEEKEEAERERERGTKIIMIGIISMVGIKFDGRSGRFERG